MSGYIPLGHSFCTRRKRFSKEIDLTSSNVLSNELRENLIAVPFIRQLEQGAACWRWGLSMVCLQAGPQTGVSYRWSSHSLA